MATSEPHNTVGMQPNDIIYVEKVGDQTAESMTNLYQEIRGLAFDLRKQGKRVLILSNAQHEGVMDSGARAVATEIGTKLDFDRSATYTSSTRVLGLRNIMTTINNLDQKVATFNTKDEALTWLLN